MKILVIRRDNIGDLVCTTPLISSLRMRFPAAWIGVLANSYNAPVLLRNPDVTEIIAYTKLKHLAGGLTSLKAIGQRIRMLLRLRKMHLDYVILATSDFRPRLVRLGRLLKPRQLVGFADGPKAVSCLDQSVDLSKLAGSHEVERVLSLAALLGVRECARGLTVVPDASDIARATAAYASMPARVKIAVHISARRPRQQWQANRFVELIQRLCESLDAACLLLWSPGPRKHPQHPGDDDKADDILKNVSPGTSIIGYPTKELPSLIGALAASDLVICADGGAMHIAAALRKPIVALFGDSPVERWRPWDTRHIALQAASGRVEDLSVDDVYAAVRRLRATIAQ